MMIFIFIFLNIWHVKSKLHLRCPAVAISLHQVPRDARSTLCRMWVQSLGAEDWGAAT